MVAYIKDIATRVDAWINDSRSSPDNIFNLLKAFREELDRLDPRDFAPSARAEFVVQRVHLRVLASSTNFTGHDEIRKTVSELKRLLTHFVDPTAGPTRPFKWLNDAKLKLIIERDYSELAGKLFPSEAWKSVVIMAGSILEAILFDLLGSAQFLGTANASPHTPKNNAGSVIPMDKWRLEQLIDVATDVTLIPQSRSNTFDQVLRDYRNFVHPKKEIRAQHECGEPEAFMARGALDALLNYLDQKYP